MIELSGANLLNSRYHKRLYGKKSKEDVESVLSHIPTNVTVAMFQFADMSLSTIYNVECTPSQ
jgi:hypothetical protein